MKKKISRWEINRCVCRILSRYFEHEHDRLDDPLENPGEKEAVSVLAEWLKDEFSIEIEEES